MIRPLSKPSARTRKGAILFWTAACSLLLVPALGAQQPPQETAEPIATGSAGVTVPGQSSFTVPFTLTPSGPRFALKPIAAALGAEVREGPKGESHSLIFEDRKFILGPGQALMLALSTDGETREELIPLSGLPMTDAQGFKVPLDVLEKTFGERLNFQFRWDPENQRLEISRPEIRELEGAINLVHQHGFSIVEIRFSRRPRYRVERPAGALEIHLMGDRLRLPPQRFAEDPLVVAILAEPDRLVFRLAGNATAAEPRLLEGRDSVSLIIDVFEDTSERQVPPPLRRRTEARTPGGVRTIVLDPGHGGDATGAVGPSGMKEADLALQVGRSLKRQLERRLPVRVVLTRNQDLDLPHDARTAIANQHKADLFISLHFNSSFGPWAHGAETYFLSREASDDLAAAAAATENRIDGAGDDPELDLQLILWDLAQTYHLAESQRFARLVQEELNLALGLRDRGVKQAPFRVLMGAKMPAVLVELGFLSNPEEEAKLQRPEYLKDLVDSLVRAVIRFKTQIEARDPAAPPADPGDSEATRQ